MSSIVTASKKLGLSVIKQRLRHQYMQRWKAKISSSSRIPLLKNVIGTFQRSRYIDTIKDPEKSFASFYGGNQLTTGGSVSQKST